MCHDRGKEGCMFLRLCVARNIRNIIYGTMVHPGDRGTNVVAFAIRCLCRFLLTELEMLNNEHATGDLVGSLSLPLSPSLCLTR